MTKPNISKEGEGATCTLEGCSKPYEQQGMCAMHRDRWRKGRPLFDDSIYAVRKSIFYEDCIEIPIGSNAKGGWTVIDLEDYEFTKYNWYDNKQGYAWRYIDYISWTMHQFILGKQKPPLVVDHIDGDTRNNRRSNLQIITQRENIIKGKLSKRNRTGVKGVSFIQGKYLAHIRHNYTQIVLGRFETLEEAAKARKAGELKYYAN